MSLPFMPMYWGDYWRDTGHLSDEEHVAYLKLISHYWQHESLPDDDARLARIAGRGQQEWQAMRETLKAFFVDGWKHNRIEKELVKQKAVRQVSVERATKAANARWNASSIPQASLEQCSTNANQNHNHIQNNNHTQNQSKEITKRVISPRGSRLPPDWQPSIEEQDFARQLGIDPFSEADRFRDYWTAQAGQRATKANWTATWRNWCRNAKPTRASSVNSMVNELLEWSKDKENESRISNESDFNPFGLLSEYKSR